MGKIDGRYLRDLRKQHGYSLRAFAEKIYTSKSTVQRWEQSFIPEIPEVIEKIAEIFNTTVDEMRHGSANKYNDEESCGDIAEGLSPDSLAELKFGTKGLTIFYRLYSLCYVAFYLLSSFNNYIKKSALFYYNFS